MQRKLEITDIIFDLSHVSTLCSLFIFIFFGVLRFFVTTFVCAIVIISTRSQTAKPQRVRTAGVSCRLLECVDGNFKF